MSDLEPTTTATGRAQERARRARGLLTTAPRLTEAERAQWAAARDAALAEAAARPPLAPNATRRGTPRSSRG